MDVKQCTSALIEINYGENITLVSEYADSRKVTINGEEEVQKFLHEHAALKDEYRNIPVTSINNEILIKSEGNIRPSEVEDLISKSKGDNIFELPDDDYAKLIKDYINDKKDKWGDIVVRISLTYPISEGMRDITVIDSPGVNAAGMVGDVTNNYIGKADAVILVKSLTGHAVESSSFREFIKSSAVGRSKAAILLVLTRKSELEDKDVNTLKEQAAIMYEGYLKPEKIAAIDSKIQLFSHKCSSNSEDEINVIMNEITDKSDSTLRSVKLYWFESGKHRTEFLNMLQKQSNFNQVISILDKFAAKAHYNQLLDFLLMIKGGYEAISKKIEERLDILKGAENPEKLKKKIEEKKDEIDEIELKIHEGIDLIRRNFIGENGIIQQEAKKAFEKFKKELSSTEGVKNIEKKILDGQDLFLNAQEDIRKRVISTCNQELISISNKTSIPAATLIPIFPSDYYKNLEEKTKKSATEDEYYTTGACWWEETHKISVYSLEKHIEFMKAKILEYLDETKKKMSGSLIDDVIKNIIPTYSKNLKENMDKKKEEYDALCRRLDDAQKMREEAKRLEKDLSDINSVSEKVNSIEGAINEVVQN